MSSCLIPNSEYRTKLAQSGMSEEAFYRETNWFMNKYGRFPNLDEIPRADSSKHLQDTLHIKNGGTSIENILESTGKNSIREATISLNDTYTDLDIDILPLNTTALVYSKNRPSPYMQLAEPRHIIDPNPNASVVFSKLLNKLSNNYGIGLNIIHDTDLKQFNLGQDNQVSAFVNNGNIYINVDVADVDAPIHELTHILLGSIRFKNPDLYFELVKTVENFSDLQARLLNQAGKVKSDAYEEIFVEEVGRYLSGLKSEIDNLPKNIQYELHYNIKRLLDTALMGQYSVKSISNENLYKMSLSQLVKSVNSMILEPLRIDLNDAQLHRMLANKKSDLFKKGDLVEVCI